MTTTVYIANLSEDVWPFISAISDPSARAAEIEENANLADRDLFALTPEDHLIFITPKHVTPEFLNYYQTLTKNRHVQVLVTKQHSGTICQDILADTDIMAAIVAAANSSRRLTLVAYATSPQFLHLVQVLRDQGLTVFTPESPQLEDAWSVNFYGSKSGIRQLAQKSAAQEPDLKMADGLIVSGITDAAKIAAWTYLEQKGVVLKTNKGHSGAGLLIFRPGDLPADYVACEQTILDRLKQDTYWKLFPIVVEDYLTPAATIGGGFPNVEFKIAKTGKIEFLYYCGMRLTTQGVFRGVAIHDSVLSDQVAAHMIDTGFFVGEQYVRAGYRGYYDVDFIVSKTGQLYVTESNVRRTGATHVYTLARQFFGPDFMSATYTLSNNGYSLPRSFTLSELLTTLSPILYHPQTKQGLIIASENLLAQNVLAYIIFAPTKARALALEQELDQLLSKTSTPL
ncbi:MAG: hypothetical protein A2784_05100 [Candidatus Chisholmbacteria bacterium RIFCSPHIGHO2_01_FULL_48_12]|uniref:ATP-grasp domain-containing protein n=1 Tax=Candidatus Chisholmbacteria bacterium RIFCSPHIGHO2_01_FULL_48_12 TaxID=1797589 RepID=A0A1G1VRR6_9BACT|nr:MAG: hypothetical protein A2784_05100 [Candidatus Chisholmbacteria bacterium RIFCSPHIGHO2_01_FULL_48_12]